MYCTVQYCKAALHEVSTVEGPQLAYVIVLYILYQFSGLAFCLKVVFGFLRRSSVSRINQINTAKPLFFAGAGRMSKCIEDISLICCTLIFSPLVYSSFTSL